MYKVMNDDKLVMFVCSWYLKESHWCAKWGRGLWQTL